jgi:hypothetical protein
MGLDMYLTARKYVSRFDYKDGIKVQESDFDALDDLAPAGLTKYGEFSGIQIEYPVGYWRKANAIHGWFVNECAKGVDDCQKVYAPREKLVELLELCKQVTHEPAMAGDVLPPTSGFFFGTYEIDDWYMQDMNYTIQMLEHVLSIIPENDWDWSFIYQASW